MFAVISAVEIQTIVPFSMKFGTVEDHDLSCMFEKKIWHWAGLLRLENLSWPDCELYRKIHKTNVLGHTQQCVFVYKIICFIVKRVFWFKSSLFLRIQNKHTNKY